MADAWYADTGLRFQCTACGDCCSGDPGNVWVNAEEIAALAAALDLTVAEFEHHYVRHIGSRRSLFERFNGDCILFDADTRKCSVYEARPTQCRTWPFWPANVEAPATWKETCEVCPGSGTGDLITTAQIRATLARHRASQR